MPKVGTKSFPYTSAGVHQAQAHAKKHWTINVNDEKRWKNETP